MREASNHLEGHRSEGGKGLVDLASDVLSEVATLIQTEFRLLRAEISEKLTFTGFSAALIGVGSLLLMATIVLLLQATIAALVAYGFSSLTAIMIVAVASLIVGGLLVWWGVKRLSLDYLTPSKTLHQIQKDAAVAKRQRPI